MKLEELSLYRSRSSNGSKSSKQILPSDLVSSSSYHLRSNKVSDKKFVGKYRVIPLLSSWYKTQDVVGMIKSLFSIVSFSSMVPTSCNWLGNPKGMAVSPGLGRKVTGTLYGYKKGYVRFAVQEDPRSEPVLLLELATPTSTLVKEMSSGLVRIALECERGLSDGRRRLKLLQEPKWLMYCNGKKCGQAISRTCVESDWHLLSIVQTVSAGAGVIPMNKRFTGNGIAEELNIVDKNEMGTELMYMRSRFERVVGNRNSEAYYMINPDCNSGPELSIFFLRI